jgi:hypothetical protein
MRTNIQLAYSLFFSWYIWWWCFFSNSFCTRHCYLCLLNNGSIFLFPGALLQKVYVYGKTYWATSSFGTYKVLSDDTKSKVSEVFLTSNGVLRDILGHFAWLLLPVIAGLGMTVLTWYMIYVDSYIPGIKPPTPFSPSKNRWVCWKVALQFNVAKQVTKCKCKVDLCTVSFKLLPLYPQGKSPWYP